MSSQAPPTAVALGPAQGGPLPPDSVRTLLWSASDDLGVLSVDVLLSRTGSGGPWELLAGGASNSGALSWQVTSPTTQDAWMRVDVRDVAGNVTTAIGSAPFTILPTAGVEADRPAAFALSPIAPNPVRGAASVDFALPVRSHVRVSVFDVQGRHVASLADGEFSAGHHVLTLEAKDLGPGLYFVRLQAPGVQLDRRAVLVH